MNRAPVNPAALGELGTALECGALETPGGRVLVSTRVVQSNPKIFLLLSSLRIKIIFLFHLFLFPLSTPPPTSPAKQPEH